MLRTKVIASSISNLTDARYFAAWGVEAMSFDLQEVSVMQVNAFKDWISGPEIIGRFSSTQDIEAIQDVAVSLGLNKIQLDPFAPKEWTFSKPVIREILLEGEEQVVLDSTSTYVLKSQNPSFSVTENGARLKQLCEKAVCYLDCNIDLENLEYILNDVRPEGIILRGGDEEKVGFKSFDELDEIMEALDED